ncbi:MAG TPA: sugar ABC transporter substrate-binding protein [Candidatus Hydrogenedentes bacterium]|nr:sugar ABC transporter substrate-binding protein [Candidatus Hydrogenedentota bacterium]
MKFRFIMGRALIVSVIAVALGCAGCGSKPEAAPNTPGTASPAKPRIALIMKSLANEFFLTMENGAKKHHAAHAAEYTLITEGIKDELDVSRQVQLVEQMIAQRMSAIIIAPADSKALVPVCKRAMEAGITVVNIDNKFDDDVLADKQVRIPFVGPDNRKGARLCAEYLAKQLAAGDPVAVLEGIPSAYNGIQRKLGFDDAIKAAGLNLVVSQVGDWEMNKANQVVSAMITEHPELKAILCANDSMALGAVAALRSAGKLAPVKVIGYDGISAVRELIAKGDMLATIEQHADQLAVFGIEYALEMLKTKQPPADRETPVDLITAANAK